MLEDASRTAQVKVRDLTESVDNLAKAKELLEPKGMTVNAADVDAFRKIAEEKVWPAYQKQFPEMWEQSSRPRSEPRIVTTPRHGPAP